MLTVLSFLFTLGVLIVVHEYGHYRVARWCGVRVLRFSVGFGRVIWRRQAHPGATEFTLSALPLGGYVRMLDSREGVVPPAAQNEAFDRQPLRRRVAIVAAGPVANLLLAIALYSAMHLIGLTEPKALLASPPAGSLMAQAGIGAGDWVRASATSADGPWRDVASLNDLRWQISRALMDGEALHLELSRADGSGRRQVLLALDHLPGREVDAAVLRQVGLVGSYRRPVMGEVRAGGPAETAGLRAGDLVRAVDGQAITDAQMLLERIRAAQAARAMSWQVERAGQRLDLQVTPRINSEGGQSVPRIDAYVGGAPETVTVRLGPWDALSRGVSQTWDMASLSVSMLGRMLVGEASIKNLSGPLTIADYAGQSVQQGWVAYLGFLALVSVSLGVLNLLPLPLLDGGHLLYYLFEGLTGRPVSDAWLKWLQRGGALVLLLMMSIALSNDVARLLGLQ